MTTNAASIHARLAVVQSRIEATCKSCGRSPSEVTLVGVSKRHSTEKVRLAAAEGLRVFGENRVQEATLKSAELLEDNAELHQHLEWHLIGPLQSNKVRPAVRLFRTIHSIDRLKIALLLDREAKKQDKHLECFLQVNLGNEPAKSGFEPGTFLQECHSLVELERLAIIGLMAIPPAEQDPERAREWFRRLRDMRDQAVEYPWWPPSGTGLSMGMSHDFEIAIEEGATHVRVGSSIFGSRS